MIEIVIKVDENVFTRLFDNGTEDYAIMNDDLFAVARAIRNGTPLPENHGRLIDADALIDSLGASDRDIYCKAVIEEDAPTIIEGSESE